MKALRIIGYVAFFGLSFALGLYFTFPWNAVGERIGVMITEQTGWDVSAEELEPSWITGIRMRGVQVEPPEATEPLELDEVVARASIMTFLTGGRGGSVWIPIGNGELDLTLTQYSETTSVQAKAESVELGLVPGFASFTGLPMSGVVSLDADIELNREDASASSGRIELEGTDLETGEGGKIANYPVPALRLGNLDWDVEFERGRADLPRQEVRGGDVELDVEGTINLASPVERTTVNITASFRPTPEFLAEEPFIKALLNNIERAKGDDGFYSYAVSGSVKHPRMFPRRR